MVSVADQIKVTFGSLGTAVGDISAGVATQGQRLSELKGDIAPMVATWEGAAQSAYLVQQTKWDAAWDELTQALQMFQNATDTANSGYSAGESANTAAWG